jgi:hypothetical protein
MSYHHDRRDVNLSWLRIDWIEWRLGVARTRRARRRLIFRRDQLGHNVDCALGMLEQRLAKEEAAEPW